MLQRMGLFALMSILACVLVGCAENKLTKQNFDTIKENVSTKLEVENTLGKPTADRGDCWEYEDEDRHLSAYIHWNSEAKVQRKEWIDAKHGVWEGAAPGIDEQPEGRPVSEHKAHTTIKKD